MDTVRTDPELRATVGAWKASGDRVAFVPTMGALHEGHLSLVRLAREHADRVVVSIFVNPTQFGPGEDLDRYPRREEEDAALLETEGCDLLFLPDPETIYPPGHATFVTPRGAAEGLEGALRPGHFRGVATVVTQLFHLVAPDVAVFGEKDAQQLAVVRQLVRDLHLPVEIVPGPTVRAEDGLALSSRNAYLSPEEREAASSIHRALVAARDLARGGERRSDPLRRRMLEILSAEPLVETEYAEVVDATSFQPVDRLASRVVLPVAARVGSTRLIDNLVLEPPAGRAKTDDRYRGTEQMERTLMKSKIHRATVTGADLAYEGSMTLDPLLMEAADLLPHERIEIYDVTNGERFATYVIEGTPGEGEVVLNGAAAHKVSPGDLVIICSYVSMGEEEARAWEPKVVFVDAENRAVDRRREMANRKAG